MNIKLYRFDYLLIQHQAVMTYATSLEEARGLLPYPLAFPNGVTVGKCIPEPTWLGPVEIIGNPQALEPQCAAAGTPSEKKLLNRQLTILSSQIETGFVDGAGL